MGKTSQRGIWQTSPRAGLALLAILAIAPTAMTPATAEEPFDINKVFWCEAGEKTGEQSEAECVQARDLILSHCTSCHAITPLVKARKDKKAWGALLNAHRSRVPDLSETDRERILKFLQSHFNPENPVPKLPPELEQLGVPPA